MTEPPWYADGIRFECQKCGKGCEGTPTYPSFVFVSQSVLDEMAAHISMSQPEFFFEYMRQTPWGWSLANKSGGCCMLQDNQCRVYPARPTQCRTWPFWPKNLADEDGWAHAKSRCIGIGAGRLWTFEEIEAKRKVVLMAGGEEWQ